MSSLNGYFGNPKPKCRRNFIQENVRQLRKIEINCHNRREISSATGKSRATRFENVPSKILPYINGSQSKSNDQKSKDATMRISRVVESPSTLSEGSHSRPSGYVTQVDITQKGHVRAKGSALKGNGPDRNKVSGEREPTVSNGSRSMGCQTVDSKNLGRLYNEGVIKYPTTKKLPGTKLRLQTDRVQSPVHGTNSAASDVLISHETNDPDIQKLSLSELKQNMNEPQEESPGIDCMKMKARSVKSRQSSPVQVVNCDLKAPSSYHRGIIPKYLQERRMEWQKKSEQRVLDTPDPACPLGHVLLPDSERRETLNVLMKSYTDLVQELNMMPVRTDTLRIRNRKIELEKQLNKIEEGIKVFSKPKVFVKIGA